MLANEALGTVFLFHVPPKAYKYASKILYLCSIKKHQPAISLHRTRIPPISTDDAPMLVVKARLKVAAEDLRPDGHTKHRAH